METASAFDAFDEALKLDPGDRDAAIEAHHEIRDILADGDVANSAILQGSFARKTMLPPLNDVDLVAFLNSEHDGLREQAGGSDAAKDLVEDAISAAHPDAEFDRSTHALKVDRGDGFTFDIVPGFDTDGDLIWIADSDDDRFELSDTRQVTTAVQQRNKDCEGAFVRQVRMVKHWMRHTFGDDIAGFVGECIAYGSITTSMAHNDACAEVFANGSVLVRSGVVHVPDSGENVLDRLTGAEIRQLLEAFENARQLAQEAQTLTSDGDHGAAIDIWHELFGDPFPEAPRMTTEDAFAKLITPGGGVTSTLRPTASAPKKGRTPATRAWAPS